VRIQLDGVSKNFQSVLALRRVSLIVEPGQIVAVLGPNGAGKTTLLRCVAGILAPTAGKISFDGEVLRRDRLDLRRRFHFLPDFPVMYPHMTPLRHMGMVLHLYEADRDGIEERVTEVLREFNLLPLAEARIGTLSRGQAYKTALAALAALDPEVWLLDEPFASGMDPQGIAALKREARDAAARGHTIIYSTQILDIAERFADRVCILHRGEVRAYDTLERLRQQVGSADGVLESIFRQLHEEDV
jgi:ABC-2 type transport system ATP-binding protein